jgi:hypothetical protein
MRISGWPNEHARIGFRWAMHRVVAFAIIFAMVQSQVAEARGLGKFLGWLLARGAVSSAVHSLPQSKTYSPDLKIYSPDILTVDQLMQCVKKASALDEESEYLRAKKSELQSIGNDVDARKGQLEMKGATVNRRSQLQVDGFNAEVDAYNAGAERLKAQEDNFNRLVTLHNAQANLFNADCAKKYYADDMESARKLAGID